MISDSARFRIILILRVITEPSSWNAGDIYTIPFGAIDGSGAMEIDLELDAADGTAMATVSVTASDAVGTVTELTISDEAACSNLSRADTSRDAINFEIDGSSGAAGEVDVILYFERSGC